MPQTKRHWLDRAADPSTPTTEDNETVRTATFEYDGKYYLVPTIRMGEDGKLYKPENPLSEALDRGDAEEFDTQEDADRMSQKISDYINRSRSKKYARGGNVQQMNKLFAEGGMMDDSGESVNGVEVPPGSLREEVADDIPAQLSEGEFVVPADVVRFIGLEKLMAMRDKAKEGLKRMEEMGQMGNADEVDNPDQTFSSEDGMDDEAFSREIDSILAEDSSAMPAGFARGGFASGTDLTKASRNPMVDVRFFKNKEGKVMFITHINGVPLTPIPEGFSETDETYEQLIGSGADKKAAEEEAAKAEELKRLAALGMGTSSSDSSGGPQGPTAAVNPNDLSRAIDIDPETGKATAKDFSKWAKIAMAILPAPLAVAIQAGAKLSAKQNEEIAAKWNASEKYFNKDAVVGGDKSTGWVNLAKAVESGMGYTVTGQGVSSTRSVQMQNDDLLDGLTEDEKALYAIPGTAEAAFQRETDIMDREEALDASIMQGESRARQASRAAAEKEAAQKAADEAAATQRAAAARAAAEQRAAEQRAAEQERARQYQETSRGSSGSSDYSSYSGAGMSQTQSSLQSDYTGGYYGNRGGLVDKRHKPAKKKGLASKQK